MVKLTFENTAVKLGKPVDPRSLTSLVLKNAQIDDLGTFEKFSALQEVDLSSNRICFQRQLTGLFAAKATVTHVNLLGNPVCTSANYRLFVIFNLPELQVLDGTDVTEQEKALAEKVIGLGEVIEVVKTRDGVEEEEAEIARLAEEASKTKIDPVKRKEDARREQERLFEEERAEAERIAAMLGAPTGTTSIESELAASSNAQAEKELKAAAAAAKAAAAKEKADRDAASKAEKEAAAKADKEAKARAKAEKDAAIKLEKEAAAKAKTEAEQAKKEADKAKKATAEQAKKEAEEAKKAAAAAAKATASAPTAESTVAPSPAVVAQDPTKESHGTAVFKDARSGLVVSTALTDRIQAAPEPVIDVKPVPQRKLATEESIFGTQSKHEELDFSRLPQAGTASSKSLFDDDDDDLLFSKASKVIEKRAAAKASTSKVKTPLTSTEGDALFEMLGSGPVRDSAKPSKEVDDLFAMLTPSASAKTSSSAKPKANVDSSNFDIDSFITTTKSSGGGLFDD